MKKHIKFAALLLAVLMALPLAGCHQNSDPVVPPAVSQEKELKDYDVPEYHVETVSKALVSHGAVDMRYFADKDSRMLFRLNSDDMTSVYIAGVNMGVSTGTTDLAAVDIAYDTYKTWFRQISEMNANTVRVFSIMPPQFYKAFYDYNASAEKKLYLIHGIWFSEDYMTAPGDCYDSSHVVLADFERRAKNTVDVVHGNGSGVHYSAHDTDRYVYDVSPYTLGFILGLEWNNEFVEKSNTHTDKAAFAGEYLKTAPGATPFEAFLARVGDTLIAYETQNYTYQTPVAFLNWSTNDTLDHPNEPDAYEDSVEVNTEHVLPQADYYAGLFAAVDAYPYYPKSIDYDTQYATYTDELTGKQNNYKAYIEDLKKEYSVPLLIAEFGVSTSRGCAAESVLGYNQGGNTEQQQGLYDSRMFVDIASAGCAGSLLFSWQDEWFKQIWNTYRYTDCEPQQRTPNRMSPEQNYGILAVEPGSRTACLVDGKTDEWSAVDALLDTADYALKVQYDEGYLYGCVELKTGTFGDQPLVIPVSTVGVGSQTSNRYGLNFEKRADSLIVLDGKDNAAVMNDAYYDYNRFRFYPEEKKTANSGEYHIVTQFVHGELELPETRQTIERKSNEVGKLRFGISDPDDDHYDSLADFYATEHIVEFRIPWYMLGVLNISKGAALNNFNKAGEAAAVDLTAISLGLSFAHQSETVKMKAIDYSPKNSQYHTRLKQSYYYIQKTLATLLGE